VPSGRARPFETIALGGLAAGTLDLLDALVMTSLNGGAPVRVLQSIASGVLGRSAYEGGVAVAALGLALHFVIAFGAATTYFLATRRLPLLLRHAVPAGLLFGLAVWGFMYFGVLPLTFGRPYVAPAWPQLLNQLGIHAFGVGLPIAWLAARSARR
jgi:hypothetical protein